MASFDNLPSEILSKIADNLPVLDLKTLLHTSKRLNTVLKDRLLTKVGLQYHGGFFERDFVHVEMVDSNPFSHVMDPHSFALRMLTRREMARSVQALVIGSRRLCWCFVPALASQQAAPCCFLNHPFFESLVGLKALIVEIGVTDGIIFPARILSMGTVPVIQRLEVLGLTSAGLTRPIPLHLHFPVEHLVSGRIKHLHLYRQHLRDPQAAHSGPPPAMRLQTIIIDDCVIASNALGFLLRSAPNVQNLSFTKGKFSAARPTADFADLGKLLMPLQNLKTLKVFSHVGEDGTILGPRTIISGVKELVVSPTVLIGRAACAPNFYGTSITSNAQVLSVAQALPSGLEQVKLVVERDQTYRIKDYTKHLAQSIYDERTRLRDLRVITLVANPCHNPVDCEHALGDHYFRQRSSKRTGIAAVPTIYQHGEPWRKCRKAGIRVDLTRVEGFDDKWTSAL